ncbi:hypothetical protein Salat_0832100 [Sesamum alatum]|uniref:Arabidopsis retrotransposon Orf1 C-terminal domain-containing protein n=1 Tax=Sesamum alatum TaxID=300844 RepID=A0AAE1YIF8_9LAMI|nr:hypothetical protein Salat_0832100 [Sesamum alatum]
MALNTVLANRNRSCRTWTSTIVKGMKASALVLLPIPVTLIMRHIEGRMTLAQFNAIFGLPVWGERREPPAFRPDEFWYDLTRQASYDATRSKSSAIINPCYRYLHRVLAHTLFGRGDSEGVVPKYLGDSLPPSPCMPVFLYRVRKKPKDGIGLTSPLVKP